MRAAVFVLLVSAVAVNAHYSRTAYSASDANYAIWASHRDNNYDSPPNPYSFNWVVKDDPLNVNYAHNEFKDDKGSVSGSYRVLLPDGRTQIVFYRDDGNGYVADVKYEDPVEYAEDTNPTYNIGSQLDPAAYSVMTYYRQ